MALFQYIGGEVRETIDFAGDYDVYRVELAGRTDYAVGAFGLPSGEGTLQDPFIHIYDSQSGQLLYEIDDSIVSGVDPVLGSMLNDALDYPVPQLGSTSFDAFSTFETPYTGTYDIVVGGVNGSSGSYTFDLGHAGNPMLFSDGL